MRAARSARIVVWRDEDVLKVPTSALFRRGEQWAVFVIEDGRAEMRMLEVGSPERRAGTLRRRYVRTHAATKDLGVKRRDAERSKNFFALGLICWMYTRPARPIVEWIEQKYAAEIDALYEG